MTLYVVATPIGNADDISLRALRILQDVDVIAAEDTRKTGRFLAGHGIKKRTISHHEHNERASANGIMSILREGSSVALVTNAGTPLISDPGYVLVTRALEEGFDVVAVPGPSAVAAALSVSGLPTHEYHFFGFAPRKQNALAKKLSAVSVLEGTLVFFESPHRVSRFLAAAFAVMGDRRVAVARELTKLHEEVARGTLSSLAETFSNRTVKGEIVVLIAGATS